MSSAFVRAMSILSVWLGGMTFVYWALAFVGLNLNPLEWGVSLRCIYAMFGFCWMALLVIVDARVNE